MLTLNKACRRSHALVHDLLPAGVGGKERLGEIAGPDRLPLDEVGLRAGRGAHCRRLHSEGHMSIVACDPAFCAKK